MYISITRQTDLIKSGDTMLTCVWFALSASASVAVAVAVYVSVCVSVDRTADRPDKERREDVTRGHQRNGARS